MTRRLHRDDHARQEDGHRPPIGTFSPLVDVDRPPLMLVLRVVPPGFGPGAVVPPPPVAWGPRPRFFSAVASSLAPLPSAPPPGASGPARLRRARARRPPAVGAGAGPRSIDRVRRLSPHLAARPQTPQARPMPNACAGCAGRPRRCTCTCAIDGPLRRILGVPNSRLMGPSTPAFGTGRAPLRACGTGRKVGRLSTGRPSGPEYRAAGLRPPAASWGGILAAPAACRPPDRPKGRQTGPSTDRARPTLTPHP